MLEDNLRSLNITLVWSPGPRQWRQCALKLPSGSTVQAALTAAGLGLQTGDGQQLQAGVWGRRVGLDWALHDGDRLELYRPLRVDPKRARRERFDQQGARTAGLFQSRRPGGKPGY